MKLAMIVAQAENRVIGINNTLPWRISADLQHFKAHTMAKPIVMGRKTFESIGRPLPGRTNIVITRQAAYAADGVVVCDSLAAALDVAKKVCAETGADEAVVIGGDQIYHMALPYVERVYLTQVHADVEGDAWFPALTFDEWKVTECERHTAAVNDSHDYSFMIYDRV